jgi:hypothetical protein
MILVIGLWTFCRAVLFGSAAIALENLALRHQLLVLQRSVVRPRLSRCDRVFWVWLSRGWASWRSSLVIGQPATVLAWLCLPFNPSRYSEDRLPVVHQGRWALAPRDTPCGATDARRRKTEEPRGPADRRLPRGGTARRSEGSYAAWHVYR